MKRKKKKQNKIVHRKYNITLLLIRMQKNNNIGTLIRITIDRIRVWDFDLL